MAVNNNASTKELLGATRVQDALESAKKGNSSGSLSVIYALAGLLEGNLIVDPIEGSGTSFSSCGRLTLSVPGFKKTFDSGIVKASSKQKVKELIGDQFLKRIEGQIGKILASYCAAEETPRYSSRMAPVTPAPKPVSTRLPAKNYDDGSLNSELVRLRLENAALKQKTILRVAEPENPLMDQIEGLHQKFLTGKLDLEQTIVLVDACNLFRTAEVVNRYDFDYDRSFTLIAVQDHSGKYLPGGFDYALQFPVATSQGADHLTTLVVSQLHAWCQAEGILRRPELYIVTRDNSGSTIAAIANALGFKARHTLTIPQLV